MLKNSNEYILNGQKIWITDRTVSDVAPVMTKTDRNTGQQGIMAFLTLTDVLRHRAETIDNDLSISAADTAEIVLNDLWIPAAKIAGKRNRGFYQLMQFLAPARANVGAQGVVSRRQHSTGRSTMPARGNSSDSHSAGGEQRVVAPVRNLKRL